MGFNDATDEALHGRPFPLCRKTDSVQIVDGNGHERIAACSSCGAKWRLSRPGPPGRPLFRPRMRMRQALRMPVFAKLIEPGTTEEGERLLGVEKPLAFWRQLSGSGAERPNHTEVIREVIKIRCKYCSNIYDFNMGKCPNCGAPP